MENIIRILVIFLLVVLLPLLLGGIIIDPLTFLQFLGAWFIGVILCLVIIVVTFFTLIILD